VSLRLGALFLQGLSTVGSLRASRLDEKINKNILGFNARLAKKDAELALKAGEETAEDIREDTTSLISKQRAAFGASNLVTTSGSPLLAQLTQREEGEKAAQSAILEGKARARQFSIRESLAEYETGLLRQRGKIERQNILLNGLTRGGSTFYRLK